MKTASRRSFLKSAAATLGAPMIVPASVLGKDGTVAPSERVTLACIGTGGQGTGNLQAFLRDERVQVVAICDVDDGHRANALGIAGLKEDAGTRDFREVVGREDVDAVMIATPDHWHSLITVAAARAGKDIYCEKPLAASIAEGRFVSDTVRKLGRVLQCGTWRRSGIHVRMACEWVRNGYIGDLKSIEVGVPGTFAIRGGFTGLEEPEPVPDSFDYALWLGPCPEAPYTAARCHFNFRWVEQYAPGYITDWGAHFIDVAHWGMDADDSGPVEVSASGVKRRDQGIYDAPESFVIEYTYPDGVALRMFSTTDQAKYGTRFVGTEGSVFTENTRLETDPPELRRTKIKPDEIHLYESRDHHRNFIDCVKSRQPTAAPVEAAHRAASACQLGAIAAQLGRPLRFDPKTERFDGDTEADTLLSRPMRGEWKLG